VATHLRVMDSKRPRPGRRFIPVEELRLEPDALRAIRALPGAHRGVSVFREVAGPFGVPDFLAVVGTEQALRNRLRLTIPPVMNEIDAGIVARAAPKTGRTIEQIADHLGWPLSTIERRVPHLLRSGALQAAGKNRYVRPAALVPVGRLYAIETKVKNFRRALRQARTYGLWCDNYVIVMPQLSQGSLVSARLSMEEDRGGLFVANRWVQRIRASELSAGRRMWGSEHLVAAVTDPSPALGGRK